jgi:hypothetical protein
MSPMGEAGKQQFLAAALLGAWGSLGLTIAHAGEPTAKVLFRGVSTHSATGVRSLDLTAPRATMPPPEARKAAESFFPLSKRPARWAELNGRTDGERIPSRAEQLARNFHRDGLPLFRLFQSQNSLVHLGLNQKGKPGLWIVQKLH